MGSKSELKKGVKMPKKLADSEIRTVETVKAELKTEEKLDKSNPLTGEILSITDKGDYQELLIFVPRSVIERRFQLGEKIKI